MFFDILWNLVLPFAAVRYRAVRIAVWGLLFAAAGLTLYYS